MTGLLRRFEPRTSSCISAARDSVERIFGVKRLAVIVDAELGAVADETGEADTGLSHMMGGSGLLRRRSSSAEEGGEAIEVARGGLLISTALSK